MKRRRRRTIRKRAVLVTAGTVVLFSGLMAWAYTPYQDRVGGVAVPMCWNNATITWRLNPALGSNVDTTGGPDVPTAVAAAFGLWPQSTLNGVVVNDLTVIPGANTTLTDPNINDCVNVVSFVPSSSVSFPTGVVAFTQIAAVSPAAGQSGPPFNYDVCGGITSDLRSVIFDADMVFNPAWSFSTATPTLPDHLDLPSVASHEFGHVLGLDHNGIAHTMMFPFGEVGIGLPRQLALDDLAGIAFLYPAQAFWDTTGTISGQVTLDGTGVFASHVVAVDSLTGVVVMDGLSAPDGTYRLVGIPSGTYRILAIPLLDPFTLDSYSGWVCGYATNPAACTGFPENPTDYSGTFY